MVKVTRHRLRFALLVVLQVVAAELHERTEVPSQLEVGSQKLVQFVSSGEAARVKARLTQIGRYWEELKESVQQLDGQLEESSSHQQKFRSSLEEVNRLLGSLHLPRQQGRYKYRACFDLYSLTGANISQ